MTRFRCTLLCVSQEIVGRNGIIGEAALVHADKEANPKLLAAITTERCVICSLDFSAFERAAALQPELRKAVDSALASWRTAVQPRTLAAFWLMAPLAAAVAATGAADNQSRRDSAANGAGSIPRGDDDAGGAGGAAPKTAQKPRRASAAGPLGAPMSPVEQLAVCCTTRVVAEGASVFGPADAPGAVIVVSGNLVEQTETVRTHGVPAAGPVVRRGWARGFICTSPCPCHHHRRV